MAEEPATITELLRAWSEGDREALERLIPLVERQLRRMAKIFMGKERPGHTLQTTALINEAYLQLAGQDRIAWQNRTHFYSVAALCMRRVLINHARARHRVKRGEDPRAISLSSVALTVERSKELLALDAALDKLEKHSERKAKIVELRYFGGYSVAEIAEMLQISKATVHRDWRYARAWLHRELESQGEN